MSDDCASVNIPPAIWEPWPHPWNPTDHCYIHGYEPIAGEPYLICGECQHCYATGDELALYFWGLVRLDAPCGRPAKPDDILFCPLCLHDF